MLDRMLRELMRKNERYDRDCGRLENEREMLKDQANELEELLAKRMKDIEEAEMDLRNRN
jgi:hypothetical protein